MAVGTSQAAVAATGQWSAPVIAALIAAGAAILSAFLSAVTSWRSSRNARLQLTQQLQHDADQRERERTMMLKRDVFLPAAEAMIRTQGALGSLADPAADHAAIVRQFTADLATIGKAQVVASESTIDAVMAYLRVVSPAYIQASIERAQMMARREAIAMAKSFMERADRDLQRYDELLKESFLSGGPDPKLAERLKHLIDTAREARKGHSERYVALLRQNAQASVEVAGRSITRALEIARTIPDTLLAARSDLEMPIDADRYRKIYEAQFAAAQQTAAEAMEQLKSLGPGGDVAGADGPKA